MIKHIFHYFQRLKRYICKDETIKPLNKTATLANDSYLKEKHMNELKRKINDKGLKLIQFYEGLELEAYPDPVSALGKTCSILKRPMRDYKTIVDWSSLDGHPWTIGYGHTGPEVVPGLVVTIERASEILSQDLSYFEKGVDRLVKVPLTPNQFSALVCFAYNCGLDEDSDTKAEGLGDSTLLKKLNNFDYIGAAEQFLAWSRAGGQVMQGLLNRRKKERELFLSND